LAARVLDPQLALPVERERVRAGAARGLAGELGAVLERELRGIEQRELAGVAERDDALAVLHRQRARGMERGRVDARPARVVLATERPDPGVAAEGQRALGAAGDEAERQQEGMPHGGNSTTDRRTRRRRARRAAWPARRRRADRRTS